MIPRPGESRGNGNPFNCLDTRLHNIDCAIVMERFKYSINSIVLGWLMSKYNWTAVAVATAGPFVPSLVSERREEIFVHLMYCLQ